LENANRTGEEILADLCVPGRDLIFVDDSGTPNEPLPLLLSNYVLMCGVLLRSEEYRLVKGRLQHFLMELGLEEFKTTHIVNPPSRSLWKRATLQKRKDSLYLLSDILAGSVETVLFCHVSGEQYYARIQPGILEMGGKEMDHKAAVEKVFFERVVHLFGPRACPTKGETAIVYDSPKPLGTNQIALEPIPDPRGFYEGSIIHVDSRVEVGIQIADFAANLLNRIHHSHQRQVDGRTNCFDEILMTAAKKMESKLVDLIGIP
jgi:hypothetical protein